MNEQYEIIAWALATEGHFTLGAQQYKEGGTISYTPYIAFSNTDRGMVDKLAGLVQCGKIYSRERPGNSKPEHNWILTGIRPVTKELLEGIIPFLPAKRRQAELLLEFYSIRKRASRKGVAMKLGQNTRVPREREIYNEMKILNKRGVN